MSKKEAAAPSLGRRTGPSFRLNKTAKRMLAFMRGQKRVDFKHMMIDAQQSALEAKLRSRRPKEDDE